MQRHIKVMFMVALAASLWTAGSAAGKDGSLKRDFLAKYEPAARRLEEFYRNIRIVAAVEIQPPLSAKEAVVAKKLDFRANGQLLRLDSFPVSGGNNYVEVIVANPARCFRASRPSDKPLFSLNSLDKRYEDRSQLIRFAHRFSTAPYGWSFCSLSDFLRRPKVEITRVEERTQDGETLTRVTFVNHEIIAGAKGTGWVDLSSKYAWAIRGYSSGAEDPNLPNREEARARIEYSGERDGIPLLARAEYWNELGPTHEMGHKWTYTVDEITVGPIPEREFTPAAIGIDIPEIGARPGFHRFLLLGIVGLLLVLIAVFIVRRRTRIFGKCSP